MKEKILVLALAAIFLSGCGNGEKTGSLADANLNQQKNDTTKNVSPGNAQKATRVDSTDQRAFWTFVAEPILRNDRKKVMATLEFPVEVYALMAKGRIGVESSAKPAKSDPGDYDRFFSKEFLKSLSTMSYKDVSGYKFNDTTVYHLVLHRQDEGKDKSLELEFHKVGIAYKLKSVNVPGGDFYEDHKKPS